MISRIFRRGVSVGDAVRSLQSSLLELGKIRKETDENAQKEKLEAVQKKIGDDFAQLIQCSLENDDNKVKLVKKFLRIDKGATHSICMQCLINEMLIYFPYDAVQNYAKIVNHIITQTKLEETRPILDEILIYYVNDKFAPALITAISPVIQEALKSGQNDHELYRLFLNKPAEEFTDVLFRRAQQSDFNLSSDAFQNLTSLVTQDNETVKKLAAEYLNENFDYFFGKYNAMIEGHYAAKRQSLKLLCDIMLENKFNKNCMFRYISQKDNLKLLMTLLAQESSNAILYEAFHIFKLFLGNPRKHPDIYRTLYRNKEQLKGFLEKFQEEKREEDQNFQHEKKVLLEKLDHMKLTPEEYATKFNAQKKRGSIKKSAPEASNTKVFYLA